MNISGKSILVTGGAGFIGSHLMDALAREKPRKLIAVDNMFLGKEENLSEARKAYPNLLLLKEDAKDFNAMKRIFDGHEVDAVFNLAVAPLPASLKMPREITDENILIVTALCELQRLGHFKTLIQFSSSEVYGSASHDIMSEDHPLGCVTPYAASKAAGDLIALSYFQTFGTDCAILRPFNNYGPRQNEGSYAGVIPLTMKRILAGESPIIYGDGLQTRDFIFVTDTARAAVEMLKNEATRGKVINVGSGKEVRIIDLVRKMMELAGCKKPIKHEEARWGDVRRHLADVTLAKKILGFKQEVGFDEGIKKTVEWYKQLLK